MWSNSHGLVGFLNTYSNSELYSISENTIASYLTPIQADTEQLSWFGRLSNTYSYSELYSISENTTASYLTPIQADMEQLSWFGRFS